MSSPSSSSPKVSEEDIDSDGDSVYDHEELVDEDSIEWLRIQDESEDV
jgi:hypothetical protein